MIVSLEHALNVLNETVKSQTMILEEMAKVIVDLHKRIERIEKSLVGAVIYIEGVEV